MEVIHILGFLLFLRCSFVCAGIDSSLNLTDFMRHRQKRSLIFEGGGIIKLAIGPILPIMLGDPVVWRGILIFYNLQGGQHPIPNQPLYPWDKWEDIFSRSMPRKLEGNSDRRSNSYEPDNSRIFLYTALESYMNRQNVDGRECLLRAICENEQMDHHVGLLAELVNIFLTPGREKLDPVYKEAHKAGTAQVDCLKLYQKCPAGVSVLDQYLDEL